MRADTECDSCGNHSLEPLDEPGAEVLECTMCGAVTGEDAAVDRVLLRREARDRGFGETVYPLAKELAVLPGLVVRKAEDGDSWGRTFPRVAMRADKRGVRQLSMLLRCLSLHRRELTLRWIVQLVLGDELLYVLKPDFQAPPAHVTPLQIDEAMEDVRKLGAFVAADRNLSWWKRD